MKKKKAVILQRSVKMVMLCNKVDKSDLIQFLALIDKNDWIAETKEDGDRVRLRFKGGKVSLTNRRGIDITEKYPELHTFECDNEVFLDGEMCVLDSKGVSQFNTGIAFRTHCKNPDVIAKAMVDYPVTFVVFDLLELGGVDLRGETLKVRRRELESLNLNHSNIKIIEQFTDIKKAWNRIEERKEEGLIIKNLNSLYREGYRSCNWRKVKNLKEVDLKFTRYDANPQGITVENTDGIRVLVAGHHQYDVRDTIDKKGEAVVTVRHLGVTNAGKYRQPTYMKLVR